MDRVGPPCGAIVVAEGVESPGQLACLRGNGCEQYQGCYFSRPLPPEEFQALMAGGQSTAPSPRAGAASGLGPDGGKGYFQR